MKTTEVAAKVRTVRPNAYYLEVLLTQDALSELEIWANPINLDTKARKVQERTLRESQGFTY